MFYRILSGRKKFIAPIFLPRPQCGSPPAGSPLVPPKVTVRDRGFASHVLEEKEGREVDSESEESISGRITKLSKALVIRGGGGGRKRNYGKEKEETGVAMCHLE